MTLTLPTITEDTISLAPGDELILRFRTWQDYEALLTRREDKAGLRIRYNSQTQEIRILSPLLRQVKDADSLADFVKALLRQIEKDWDAFTPITLKRINQQGIEPDYCNIAIAAGKWVRVWRCASLKPRSLFARIVNFDAFFG